MRRPWQLDPEPKVREDGVFVWHACTGCFKLVRWAEALCFKCLGVQTKRRQVSERNYNSRQHGWEGR